MTDYEQRQKELQKEYDRLEKQWKWVYMLFGLSLVLQLIAIIGKAVTGG